MTNLTDHTTLRSDTYRDELADVAASTHDETGPQPTVQEIEAVLADLDAAGPRKRRPMNGLPSTDG